MSQVFTPWTDKQVDSLNSYQHSNFVHPFTCACRNDLIATNSGWICNYCDYTQNWAHDWMTDGSWEKAAKETESLFKKSECL